MQRIEGLDVNRKCFHGAFLDHSIEFQKIDALQNGIQSFCSFNQRLIIQLGFHTTPQQHPPAFDFEEFT